MTTVLKKIKSKNIIFENIQGFVGIRHYILPHLINNDKILQNQLKVFNGILKDNRLSSNLINNLLTFISDRLLFRTINEDKNFMDDSQYLPEEGEINKYHILKKRLFCIYESGKYHNDTNIKINELKKYFPNNKEFALFLFDYLENKNKNLILSIFPEYNLEEKSDINKFLSYYQKNITLFQNKEKKDQISINETENIYYKMNRKVLINIAFIGNRKSGKSTTIGHLLYSTGIINQNEFIKIYNQSIEYGYPSYRYSFLINTYKEKQCLTTMIFHIKKFETKKYDFNLIDLPGYFKYRKNMIKGVSLADAAVIVISAENEQSKNDNIKDYLIIAYTMRIRQLIFAISKMDEIKYSEETFLKIKKNMINLCISIGFNLDDIQFIPYSGFTGQNLVNKYEDEDILKINKMDWYKGETILESLDELKPPKRFLDEPLIISNFHVDKVSGVGTVLEGKILSGKLKIGMELCIPTVINKINDIYKIECNTIGMYNKQIKKAIAGDIIGFHVKGITKPQGKLSKLVFTINSKSIINADNLRAKIFMINKKVSIRIGSVLTLFCYTQNISIKIEKIEYLVSEADKILEKEPKEIHCGESAIIIMKLIKRELNNWNWYKA